MEAFSRALRQLPTIIADNAGLDSSELVTQVGTCHTCTAVSCCECVCVGLLQVMLPTYGLRH
jgi:hypothetical protein